MSIATKCTCGHSLSGICLESIKECENLYRIEYNDGIGTFGTEMGNTAHLDNPTQLETLERNINRIDLLLLSLWVIALFGITYLLTQFL